MIRFLTRNDCHLSDKNPISRIDEYKNSILDKINQTYIISTEKKCNSIIDAGDFFHIKDPKRTSHELMQKIIQQHGTYTMLIDSIIGNHDVRFYDINTISEQPLGVLYESGIFQRLEEKIYTDGITKVRLVGIHYSADPTNDIYEKTKRKDEDILIAVFHGNVDDVSSFPGEMFFSFNSLSNLPPDIWVLGHIHKNQGIKKVNGKYFVALGALSRGSLTYDEIMRIPSVGLITIEDDSSIHIEEILLKVTSSENIFNIKKYEDKKEESKNIENFITSLSQVTTEDIQHKLEKSLSTLDIVDKVREKLFYYIDRAENE